MIDRHIDVTKKAYDQVPLQAYLRIAWFVFCCFVCSVWLRVYFDESLKEKTCYIE